MNIVLDACAIIAYLRDESGAEIVEAIIEDKSNRCFIHAINACEIYYGFLRSAGEVIAQATITEIDSAGVIIIDTFDRELWQIAGQLKARNRLSLADCIALSLAIRMQATLVTSDHHELDTINNQGICQIRFIR